MSDIANRLKELDHSCPGMIALRRILNKAAKDTGTPDILVDDGGDYQVYPATQKGVHDAAHWALEVDGIVQFGFKVEGRRAWVQVLYDGPYDRENAEEIILDYSLKLKLFGDEDELTEA